MKGRHAIPSGATGASACSSSAVDFKLLERASDNLQEKMRYDERHPDLHDQFAFRPDIVGGQHYYVEPYRSSWGPMVEHSGFIPLPRKIADNYRNVECASFMGLIPEIDRVWVTVDKKLYMWNYMSPNDDVLVYDGIAEVIVAVCLCTPKPDLFVDDVRYLLVVASAAEVALVAISCDEELQDLKLLPTAYVMPTDNVTMVKLIGSQHGRIFMAGNDSNIYELEYGNSQGVWTSVLGLGSETRHKCRKINHYAWNWKLVHILPPFLRSMAGKEDRIVDLLIDNVRLICYTITRRGFLTAFYFGADGKQTHLFLNSMSTLDAARSHLRYSRNDSSPKVENFTNSSSAGFEISSMHSIPHTESKKVQLILILKNGIRIFLAIIFSEDYGNPPVDMRVIYVRSPPSPATLRSSAHSKPVVDMLVDTDRQSTLDPIIPQYLPGQSIEVGPTFYSSGVFLGAISRPQRPDEVICAFEDLLGRSNLNVGFAATYQQPSLREGLCVPIDERENGGRVYDIKESCGAVKNLSGSIIATLYAQSHLPATNQIIKDETKICWGNNKTDHRLRNASLGWFSSNGQECDLNTSTPVPVWSGSSFLAMHGSNSDIVSGYERNNLHNVALLGSLAWQHAPASTTSFRRHFFVLSNRGVHVLHHVRPADVLYRHISHIHENCEEMCQNFFLYFGDLEASTMCIALACGLPYDAGDTSRADGSRVNSVSSTGLPLDMIQTRAMNLMLGLTKRPRFESTVGRSNTVGGSIINQDSRLVLSGGGHQFHYSIAHDALYLFSSRLLRSIWLRPITKNDKVIFPAWPLLTHQIRPPLYQLQKIIRGYFAAAVINDPRQVDFIAALTNNLSEDLLTQQILHQTQSMASNDKMLHHLAKNVEDASINALYRFNSRVLQALSLLEILIAVQGRDKIRVTWKLLDSFSFRSLVLSVKAHEAVKKLINEMLEQYRKAADLKSADKVIGWLSTDCYNYFSIGDKCAFEALCIIDQLVDTLQNNDEISERQLLDSRSTCSRCITLLLRAAFFWSNLEMVSGIHSPLCRFCGDLLQLGRVGRLGIVDLCLVTAGNFLGEEEEYSNGQRNEPVSRNLNRRITLLRSANHMSGTESFGGKEQLHWEQLMYHGSAVKTDAERRNCISACYACLVESIVTAGTAHSNLGAGILDFDDFVAVKAQYRARMLSSDEARNLASENMKEMANRALESCADPMLHEMLCDRLLVDHKDILLAIESIHIETFLNSKDVELAYCYYHGHGQFKKAALWMDSLARSENNSFDIDQRISYLRKATASAELCSADAPSTNTMTGSAILAGQVQDIRDALEVAEYQKRILELLVEDLNRYDHTVLDEVQRRQLEQMRKTSNRCRYSLLSITELFYDVCQPYKLWEMCLLILNVSKHEDDELVTRIWRSIIYREIPLDAKDERATILLQMKREPGNTDTDKRRQRTDMIFENSGVWLPILRERVIDLGRQLGAAESRSTAFPFAAVLEELEEVLSVLMLVHILSDDQDNRIGERVQLKYLRGWAVQCMKDIGFTFSTLIESYMEIFDRWAGKAPEKLLQVLSSTSYVLRLWCRGVSQKANENLIETRQLLQVIRSGRIRQWLDKVRRQISTLSARSMTHSCRDALREISEEVAEIDKSIRELTYT